MQPLKDPVSDPAAASAAVKVTERATLAPWRCVGAVSHVSSLRICGQSHGDFCRSNTRTALRTSWWSSQPLSDKLDVFVPQGAEGEPTELFGRWVTGVYASRLAGRRHF